MTPFLKILVWIFKKKNGNNFSSNISSVADAKSYPTVIDIGFRLVCKIVGQTRKLEFVESGVPSRHFMTHTSQ